VIICANMLLNTLTYELWKKTNMAVFFLNTV